MSKNQRKHKEQALEVPVMGSRAIEKHYSWIPLRGLEQSIFLMLCKDTRNWKDGSVKSLSLTNKELARRFHYSTRTVQRSTQALLNKGYIEVERDFKNVAGNVITIGNKFIVPEHIYHVACLYKLNASIVNLESKRHNAEDKRSEFHNIVGYLKLIKEHRHIFLPPAKLSPAHDNVSSPHDKGVTVNSTRAAAKPRAAAIPKSHSYNNTPNNPAKPADPPKELVSEVFKKLKAVNLFERFVSALNQAPDSKRSINSFCKNIAKSIEANGYGLVDKLHKSLALIEKYEVLQKPRESGKSHSLARLIYLEELQETVENTTAFALDRLKKRNGFYQKSDINRVAKMLGLSPQGVMQLIDSRQEPSSLVVAPKAGGSGASKPSRIPQSVAEFDKVLAAYFAADSQERFEFYNSDERPYLNNIEDFRSFFELHIGTEDEL